MAKYDITYACGHEGTVNLVGKIKERERYIEWVEAHKLCPQCYAEKRQKDHDEENRRAAEAEAMGLPALTGTPKQVAWATTIRQHVIDLTLQREQEHLRVLHQHLRDEVVDEAKKTGVYDDLAKLGNVNPILGWTGLDDIKEDFDAAVRSMTDAEFWIEHQDHRDIAVVFARRCAEKIVNHLLAAKAENRGVADGGDI